jgi:TIR domain
MNAKQASKGSRGIGKIEATRERHLNSLRQAKDNRMDGLPTIEEPAPEAEAVPSFTLFINYRHDETGWAAWALYLKLSERFQRDNVFFDRATLRPGVEWLTEIKSSANRRGALLALIGCKWMALLASKRQEGIDDYVTKELNIALHSGNRVQVIPVLVDDAVLPPTSDLPWELKDLTGRQADRILQARADEDMERLVTRIFELSGERVAG